jgi:two-component system, chemotaxis family, sensor kinase CheA
MDDELLGVFIGECREHLATIEADLLLLEEHGDAIDEGLVNKVFRAAHSIKGGAGFFGLDKVRQLAHGAETVLDMIRSRQMVPTPEGTNILLAVFDQLREMINRPDASEQADIAELLVSLTGLASSYLPAEQKASLRTMVTFAVPGIGATISLPQTDVDRARRDTQYIYWVDCDLVHDIEQRGQDILTLFHQMWAAGDILDCAVDIAAVGTLDDVVGNRVPLRLVVATILDPEFVGGLFETIDPARIYLLMDPSVAVAAAVPAARSSASPAQVRPAAAGTTPTQPATPDVAGARPALELVPPPAAAPAPHHAEAADQSSGSSAGIGPAQAEDTLRVNVALLEALVNLAGELVLSRNQLRTAVAKEDRRMLLAVDQRVNQVTSELQDVIMQTRLQPIGNVFARFARVVRDLSRSLGKQVDLDIEGKDVALDKSIIEGLSDPLTHMVRNAVDHGIETVEERIAAGKKPSGTLRIVARHEAGQVVVEIADDGKGIDVRSVVDSAVRRGVITAEKAAAMSERDRRALIFAPGVSTAQQVTEISGRGVGMDVVKSNLDRLGGQVEILSEPGRGTTFRIKLPLTLAIIPSLIVSVEGERFAIPQANVEELLRLRADDMRRRVEMVGDAELLLLRDRVLPIARFGKVLRETAGGTTPSVPDTDAPRATTEIVVVNSGSLSFALVVDAYYDTEEVVVKPLGRRLKQLHEYSGATILGDGGVTLIIDAAGVAARTGVQHTSSAASAMEAAAAEAVAEVMSDLQSLVLFRNASEPCAVPLELIARIERIEPGQVEHLGNRRTMQYRGRALPLVTLADAASVEPVDETGELIVLVAGIGGHEIGLLGSAPVDVVETRAEIDTVTHRQPGIAGSAIIAGGTTLIADLYELAAITHPEWGPVAATRPAAGAGSPGSAVLLAEDSDFFRAQVTRLLEDDGYEVLAAPNGEAAWDLLVENAGRVGVVVTDIEMPLLDGLGLATRIRADDRTNAIPVIAVTSLAGEDDMAKGRAAGVSEYHVKLDRERLLESVHAYARAS